MDIETINVAINGLTVVSNGEFQKGYSGDSSKIDEVSGYSDYSRAYVRIDPEEPIRSNDYIITYSIMDLNGNKLSGKFKFIADRINNFTRSGRHNLIAIHPLAKSGNAEGFEHDLQQGRFWDKENWLDLCKLLIDEGNILLFVGYGDEDWGLYEDLNSEYDFKVIDGRASVENTIDIINVKIK